MGIRTRIFFITLSCLFIGISLSFIVAERDLSIKLQAQIETELSRQAKILRKSISGLIDSGDLVSLKAQVDEYASASDSRITIILKNGDVTVSYTHLRAHETVLDLVCRLLLEKKKKTPTHHIPPHFTLDIIQM